MDAETGGFNYDATHGPTEFDGYWDDVYADLFPDIDAYLAIVEPLGLNAEAASAKIMKAYTLFMRVDLFDAVPLSQAGLGGTNNTPVADSGADVYDAAVALLDEAITQLTDADNFASSAFDNFYGGDAGDWLTLANTLKLRAAVTTRLVNGAGGAGAINAIVDGGDFIAANGQNFEYQFGTNRANPNNRHPWYNNSYEEDDGRYQSNWFMWLMAESKGFVDPRTRYYFYRQETNLEPIWSDQDGANAFDCIHTQVPTRDFDLPHYTAINPDMPYCLGSYDLGYFGRDHLNGSGIPPDGQLRTVYGLYPAGGKFDNGARDGDVLNAGTDGALGEGVHPFWQASWTHFLLAEAALTMGTGGDARELLKAGIELSQSRVRSFESLVDGSEIVTTTPSILTVGETFPADSLWTQYVDFVLAEYDAAGSDNDRLGIVSREYLIALWGNGIEGYNLYRRTCLPAQIQPGVDPNFGNFIRSALYPAVHVNLNQNISQKDDITMPVFWDTNDASCNY
ncbi:MAG: SusD/RagB family nutrient-binding outer membrane lipoprotein, partial [Bacteroidota bacterium]